MPKSRSLKELGNVELRHNSQDPKGGGFLGPIFLPGGRSVATEYSIGVPINGRETDIPTLVPNLSPDELSQMIIDIIPNKRKVPMPIVRKAVAHALDQRRLGRSDFFNGSKEPDLNQFLDAVLGTIGESLP